MAPLPSVDSLLMRTSKHTNRSCKHCGTKSTAQWRYSECGQKLLCNACGIRWVVQGQALTTIISRYFSDYGASLRAERNADVDQDLVHQHLILWTTTRAYCTLQILRTWVLLTLQYFPTLPQYGPRLSRGHRSSSTTITLLRRYRPVSWAPPRVLYAREKSLSRHRWLYNICSMTRNRFPWSDCILELEDHRLLRVLFIPRAASTPVNYCLLLVLIFIYSRQVLSK